MSADLPISREVTDRQIAMFAMFVGPGLFTTRAALAAASRVPESTLRSYASGAAMPLAMALHLRKFLPLEAVNMMTEPGGVRFSNIEQSSSNWDSAAADAASLVAEVCVARSDGMIDHREDEALRRKARHLIAELTEIAGGG
jgi:hypothetical protein